MAHGTILAGDSKPYHSQDKDRGFKAALFALLLRAGTRSSQVNTVNIARARA
jgi:hypothetical protein